MNATTSESETANETDRARVLSALTTSLAEFGRRYSFASRGLFSIVDQAIFSGTSFLTAALIGRFTSPDQLGLYYLVLSVVLIITGIQENLIAAPYAVYSKRHQGKELAEYAGSAWAHFVAVSFLAVVGVTIAIPMFLLEGQSRIVPGLWAVIAVGPMLMFRQWIRRYTFASANVKSAIALDAIAAGLQLSALAALGYFGLLSLFRIFVVMGAA